MTDPLTIFVIAASCWGVYRRFIKHRLPNREEALFLLGFRPDLPDEQPQQPQQPQPRPTPQPVAVTGDPAIRVRKAVAELPSMVLLANILPRISPSKLAVPLGIDFQGAIRSLDFGDDTLNVAVYGGSGSGKDTVTMGWFMALTSRNTPEDLQFIVLDGKGHWLTPNLKSRAHMVIDPCGGYGEKGTERIEQGLDLIDAEAERRSDLIFGSGYRSREQYVTKTGNVLPMIVVLITDGMDAIQGLIEQRLISLASKGRALGFKVVVSMSTPTKRDMRWRINLSTVMSGPLQDRSQNAVALGLPTDSIVFPPSFLPDPRRRHGTFVVRLGDEQTIVQAPFVSDEEFDAYVVRMPARREEHTQLLDTLLGSVTSARAAEGGSGSPSEFVDTVVVDSPGRSLTGAALYAAYREWCASMQYTPINNTAFGIAAKDLGLTKIRSSKGIVMYSNISLAEVLDDA
jgi:DNA segregation ATPase FtsK/SpoIIIE-like protein